MSRSGYSDDCENIVLWRTAVRNAIYGKRGQAMLRDLAAALDAMPKKTLAAKSLVTEDGEFCALGVLGQACGLDMSPIDPEDWDAVAKAFNIAPAMAREIVYENDESVYGSESVEFVLCGPVSLYYPDWGQHVRRIYMPIPEEVLGEKRWKHMRNWVQSNIAASDGEGQS